MTLGTSAAVRVATTHGSTLDLGSSSATQLISVGLTLADGTGAGEADLAFVDSRTLAASASENIDLAGSLVDALGAAVVFARVKALVVKASADNTNNVLVGTGDLLAVANSAGSTEVVYDIAIVGCSA